MIDLSEGYVGSSCVLKAMNNELITMGVLQRIGKTYIDIGNSRNVLPVIPYMLPVKIELHNPLGFKVLTGQVYLSSRKLVRVMDLNEAADDERRQYFRLNTEAPGAIYNCMRGDEMLAMGGHPAGSNGLKVRLADISLGGLMFASKEHFEAGDCFDIVIPEMGESMLYACQVRRAVEQPDGTTGYGCKWMDMEIKQEDLLYHYLLKIRREQQRRTR